jgi:hypothetical protein
VLEPKTLAGFLAVVAFTITANLMLKLGAGASEAERVFGLLGWKSVAGLALFGCGAIVYTFLLRRVPLNIAQVFTSAQFVGVIVAASLVLGGADFGRALAGDRLHQLRDRLGRPYSQYLRAVW